jgi:ribonuclease HII
MAKSRSGALTRENAARSRRGSPRGPSPGASRSPRIPPRPGLAHERALWDAGHRIVAGVDEVGRGAWAGPLSVGVAVLGECPPRVVRGLRDSKQLPEEVRESLFDRVAAWCTAWAVGHAWHDECDRLGMTAALRLATRRALSQLPDELEPDAVVLDGTFDYVSPPAEPTLFDLDACEPALSRPGPAPHVITVVKGDARCASVAAASVLAKVTRDRIMRASAHCYPGFDFERNKGYPSPVHQRALCGYGLSAVHRRSWAFVGNLPWELTVWPGSASAVLDEVAPTEGDLDSHLDDDLDDDLDDEDGRARRLTDADEFLEVTEAHA